MPTALAAASKCFYSLCREGSSSTKNKKIAQLNDQVSIRFVAKGLRQQKEIVVRVGNGSLEFLFALSRRVFVNTMGTTCHWSSRTCFYSLCREGSSSTGRRCPEAQPGLVSIRFVAKGLRQPARLGTYQDGSCVSIRFVAKGLRQHHIQQSWPQALTEVFLFALSRRVFVNRGSRGSGHNPRRFYSLCREGSSSTRHRYRPPACRHVFLFALSRRVFVNVKKLRGLLGKKCFYSLCREGSSSTGQAAAGTRGRPHVSIRFVAKGLRQRVLNALQPNSAVPGFYSLCREGSSSTTRSPRPDAAGAPAGFYSLCREGSSSTVLPWMGS